jgi:hypothetical protein
VSSASGTRGSTRCRKPEPWSELKFWHPSSLNLRNRTIVVYSVATNKRSDLGTWERSFIVFEWGSVPRGSCVPGLVAPEAWQTNLSLIPDLICYKAIWFWFVNVFLRHIRVSSPFSNESGSRLVSSSMTWSMMIQSSISLWKRMNWSGQTVLDSPRKGTGDLWQFHWLCDFTQTVKHDLLRWTTKTVKERQKYKKTETIVRSRSTKRRKEDGKAMVEWMPIESRMRSRDQAAFQSELHLVDED